MGVFPTNAAIIFSLPTGETRVGFDGDLETPVKKLIVTASLKINTREERRKISEDSDLFTIDVTGRAVDPIALPNTIKPGSAGEAVIWRVDESFIVPDTFANLDALAAFRADSAVRELQTGTFFLKADLGSRFGIQDVLGDKLDGQLLTEVSWTKAI